MFNKSKTFQIFDSDALKNFHKRIFFSIIIFLFCYFTAIFRIADLMILEINSNESLEIANKPERGKIYDRNGQLLSTNIKSYSLFANALQIKNRFLLSKKLSLIINVNTDEIYKKLNTNKHFVYLKRNISPKEHQKIIELGEINLKTQLENKRVYPYQHTSSHILYQNLIITVILYVLQQMQLVIIGMILK